MLIKADAKQIEWRVAVDLSNDSVGLQELFDGVDVHSNNQGVLGLPSRLVAKTYLFRLIYGGTEYAYAGDAEFNWISNKPAYWKEIIDRTYRKYSGLSQWHTELMTTAISTGKLSIPSGREWIFEPYLNKRGEMQWPRTNILNYPVQGFSADIISIARVSLKKRISDLPGVLLINTVHDDIHVDAPSSQVEKVCNIFFSVYDDLVENIRRVYRYEFKAPLACEVFYGPNLANLEEFKR